MDIDSEHLGIPETTYDAVVTMSSVRFREIVSDLSVMSDAGMEKRTEIVGCGRLSISPLVVTIECTKEGIKFSNEGEMGKGSITLKANSMVDSVCVNI